MVLGVFGAAISAFAIDDNTLMSANPATGQPISWTPIIVGVIALVVAIICVVLSKKNNKPVDENVEKDYINEDDVESGLHFFTSRKDEIIVQKTEDDVSEKKPAEDADTTEE